jgi:hypothetical protein
LGGGERATPLPELGHEHRFALHPAEDHLTFTVKDDWSRESTWLAGHDRRTTDPHRVTLAVRPASLLRDSRAHLDPLVDDLLAEVGARTDGGYWVGDVVPAGEGDVTGSIDLVSDGIARRASGTTSLQEPGVDGPSPYLLTGTEVAWTDGATDDVLRGTLVDVESLTVDVGRAGLSDDPTIDIAADREVRLTLVRDGQPVGTTTIAPVG